MTKFSYFHVTFVDLPCVKKNVLALFEYNFTLLHSAHFKLEIQIFEN